MIPMIILFFAISLGTIITVPLGDSVYQVEYAEITVLILFLGIGINYITRNKKFRLTFFQRNIFMLFLLLFFYAIFIFLWTNHGLTILPGAMPLLYGALTVIISSYYLEGNKERYIILIRVLVTIMIIQLAINMIGLIGSNVSGFYDAKDYARTPMGKSNLISFYFVFGLLYEFISKEKFWKFFFAVNLAGVVLTLSRGAIFSLGFALGIYLIVSLINKNFKNLNVIMSFVVLIVLFSLAMVTTTVGEEFLSALSRGLQANTVGTRQVLWQNSINEIIHSPLGVGVVWREDPHNFILSAWRNLGVIFGSVYLIYLSYPMVYFLNIKIKEFNTKTIALLVAYSSVYIHALVEVYYFSTVSIIWTVITINYIHMQVMENQNDLRNNLSNGVLLSQSSHYSGGFYE